MTPRDRGSLGLHASPAERAVRPGDHGVSLIWDRKAVGVPGEGRGQLGYVQDASSPTGPCTPVVSSWLAPCMKPCRPLDEHKDGRPLPGEALRLARMSRGGPPGFTGPPPGGLCGGAGLDEELVFNEPQAVPLSVGAPRHVRFLGDSFDRGGLPSVPEEPQTHQRPASDARANRACDMAACDAHQFCDEDTREWDDVTTKHTREETVDLGHFRAGGASDVIPEERGTPRYSYMLSVPEGQIGMTPSGWPPAPIYVKKVAPRSPAASVFCELGDEILALNGRPVYDMDRATFDLNMRQRPLVLWMHRTQAERMSL